MKKDALSEQSIDFAVSIVGLARSLREQKEFIISPQIGRSGTSIGANICEAQYAQSKADFISKLQIALKEANETRYWLELLFRCSYLSENEYEALYNSCSDIIRLLTASIKTAKQ